MASSAAWLDGVSSAGWSEIRRAAGTPALDETGRLLREVEAEAAAPDLWEAIRLRLPALDAKRAEAEKPLPAAIPSLGSVSLGGCGQSRQRRWHWRSASNGAMLPFRGPCAGSTPEASR